MSYSVISKALGAEAADDVPCPGQFQVTIVKPNGDARSAWCADTCPAPWEADDGWDDDAKFCYVPESDYQDMLAKGEVPAANTDPDQAGISVSPWAIAALAVVGAGVVYAATR
jgi:hypothetical protein